MSSRIHGSRNILVFVSVLCFVSTTFALTRITNLTPNIRNLRSLRLSMGLIVEKDEMSVGVALCKILETEYQRSILRKGSFAFSISGGSMLKMLSNLRDVSNNGIDWSKCTMGFVSHRCVGLEDDAATFHKAKPLFLDAWMSDGLKVLTVTGSTDAEKEAISYEESLRALPADILPWNSDGYPVFDLLLIGVGTDGHVGSIYPNLPDTESCRVVVPVTQPASKPVKISLSLKSMLASRASVVACAGKSSKVCRRLFCSFFICSRCDMFCA